MFDMEKNTVVYQNMVDVTVSIPYHAGFLSYREMSVYRVLMDKLKHDHPELIPQILLVDGQGRLHPRHFGSACCVGLEFGVPTIGVGKNPFCGAEFINEEKEKLMEGKVDPLVKANTIPLTDQNNHQLEGVNVCWDTKVFKSHLGQYDVCFFGGSDQ